MIPGCCIYSELHIVQWPPTSEKSVFEPAKCLVGQQSSPKTVIFLKCHAFHCCSLLWPDDVSVFLFDKDWAVALQALCDRLISFITILFCCWIRTMGLMRKMYNTYIFSLVKVQGIPYFIADITRKRIYRCAACHYLVFTSHLFHLNNTTNTHMSCQI